MYLEIILLLLHFTPTVAASLKIRKRLILTKLLPPPAPFQHCRFRVRFRFQSLSSKRFRFHKKLTASASLFAMVIDEITENARQGWMKQILYADDLVLMEETMKELRENFEEWREAFESKRMSVNLGKKKLMVSGMKEETFDSKIDPCGVCGTRVMSNSVLCTLYSMWLVVHARCTNTKKVAV